MEVSDLDEYAVKVEDAIVGTDSILTATFEMISFPGGQGAAVTVPGTLTTGDRIVSPPWHLPR